MTPSRPPQSRIALAILAGLLLMTSAPRSHAAPSRPEGAAVARYDEPWIDPLLPMVRRLDRYLQSYAVDGVTMDWRYQVSPSEEIRQTVVCQLLAYVELARLDPRPRLRVEVVRHADFLLGRLEEIRSYTPFDGMLAYSLLAAHDVTGEARFLAAGAAVTQDLLAIPTSQCVLNGGLMVAMATAQYALLTGNAEAAQKTRDIVAQLAPYQNPDGSFPHWCWGSRDIHYTAWMAMELLHIRRMIDDDHIAPYLAGMTGFLEGRIASDGSAVYEQPCPGIPDCTEYFYSRATGCSYDLDSRGWTVEPAYCGLLFDAMGSARYEPVMTFLDSLEDGGTIADLYGYWPPPSDPEYPWTIADTSVVCMSIVFWALATEVADRVERGVPVDLVLDDVTDVPPGPPPAARTRPLVVAPNPARGGCTLRFSLAADRPGRLDIFDAGGRRVRALECGVLVAGDHAPAWDGRDDGGRAVPAGIYVARLVAGEGSGTRRFTLVR